MALKVLLQRREEIKCYESVKKEMKREILVKEDKNLFCPTFDGMPRNICEMIRNHTSVPSTIVCRNVINSQSVWP